MWNLPFQNKESTISIFDTPIFFLERRKKKTKRHFFLFISLIK